ncbi:FtsX-like permease family protein [Bacillus alkalicellulosilyticus]|uniref:FtsX-like permease family protein n=1 Tax=Alkalihalobacterium alkalicellulosilyticum TaxID=1912214 RepID=UPI000997E0CA|nr:ABC transporter permease [Bacillus alkalicellulosilyticus]
MTFRQFAFNNVLRNKRLYLAYFLSSMFTVMVFFTFAIFAFHPAFSSGAINQNVLFGMGVAGGIIYVFSFFYILYSMSSFLQSRKKEFGLLIMLGASNRQVRLMIFLENILVGFYATVGGIVIGLVFAKAILLVAENVLIISETLDFYVPIQAIVVTFISFLFLFFCISIFVSFILRTKKLTDLIKADKQPKGDPKASIILSILAALLLISGYSTATLVKGIYVVYAMIPVIIVVTLGTYLLFTQLSVYLIRLLKRNTPIFWHKTNMLLFSDLAFRLKDNARTFFMVAIISTVAFSAIGTLYGLQSVLTKGIKEANPYPITYTPFQDDEEAMVEEEMNTINAILQQENIDAEMKSVEMSYFEIAEREIFIARASDYNRFAAFVGAEELQPSEDEVIVVDQTVAVLDDGLKASEVLMNSRVQLEDGRELQPNKIVNSTVLPTMYGYYVVNDKTFEQLSSPVRENYSFVWIAKEGQTDQLIEAGREIYNLDGELKYKGVFLDYTIYEINKAYGPVLFIGLFIGIVFFVSAGSFLYFRLFTDLDEEKRKFQAISRIGLTQSELQTVMNRQIAILFFSPIVVALTHGAVALTALSRLFDYNLTVESSLVLGSFALIQVIYFLFVRFFYIKQVSKMSFKDA